MDEKQIKIYATALGVIGFLIAVFQFFKLNDISSFIATNQLTGINKPSFILNYIFLFLLLAILISLFILVYFGLLNRKQYDEEIDFPEIDDAKIEESLKNKNSIQELQDIDAKTEQLLNNLGEIKDKKEILTAVLHRLAPEFNIVQGIAYIKNGENKFKLAAKYAYYILDTEPEFVLGEGLHGQAAQDKKILYISNIPDNYITVLSGLGSSAPKYLVLFPIVKNDETIALIEIAAFSDLAPFKYYAEPLNQFLAEKL